MNESDIGQYNQQQRRNLAKGLRILIGLILVGTILLNNLISLLRGNDTFWPLLINGIWIGAVLVCMPTLVEWHYRLFRNAGEIVMPANNAEKSPSISSDSTDNLSILPSRMLTVYAARAKNEALVKILAWGIAIIGIVFGIWHHQGGSEAAGFFTLLVPIMITLTTRNEQKLRETAQTLAMHSQNTGFILKTEGFMCNIALMFGEYERMMAKSSMGICEFPWNKLRFMSVNPVISHGKGADTPALYTFILKQPHPAPYAQEGQPIPQDIVGGSPLTFNEVSILREPFYGREQEIINYIKIHAGIPIEMKDEPR